MEQYNLKLSERLIAVAEFLPKRAKFADIGSDHAYLPCFVCLHDEQALAIAGEVNRGPFESAQKNVSKQGLEERIVVRLGNGLEVINEDDHIEQIVIAGMGGGLITNILDKGVEKLSTVNRLILQPNVDARQIRVWLNEHQFDLTAERILEENGHIYEILVADRNGVHPYKSGMIEKQLLLGPYLMEEKSSIFLKKWREEASKLKLVIEQMKQAAQPDEQKIKKFTQELSWIEEELNHG